MSSRPLERAALPLAALAWLVAPLAVGPALTACTKGSSNLPLVINEVHATPPEWVEIVNLSDQLLPLRDVQLTGSDEDGRPSDERAQLPDIAILPGEHLVVALGKLDADSELHGARECGIEGVSECAFAAFRVRADAGETVHLFENARHIDAFVYEPRGAGLDETQCRLPDGTGDIMVCAPTAAAPNAPVATP
ncbi:MAG: hypothetical protein R3B40_15865 [Polyangiales bacterium]